MKGIDNYHPAHNLGIQPRILTYSKSPIRGVGHAPGLDLTLSEK